MTLDGKAGKDKFEGQNPTKLEHPWAKDAPETTGRLLEPTTHQII